MTSTLTDAHAEYRDELVGAGLLVPSGVDGVYGRNAVFEGVLENFDKLVAALSLSDGPEVFRFPPLLPRSVYERTDYLRSFPNLMGAIHSFHAGDKEHAKLLATFEDGGDWSGALERTDLMLCPAACYPLYPMASGTLPAGGRLFDVFGYCFRHEPSIDPARMQLFRMHEQVILGSPDQVVGFRDRWIDRGLALLGGLGLPVRSETANDPFFGRAGRMLAVNQRDEELKFELVVPICSDDKPTAIASCNYHKEHLGVPFAVDQADGSVAHSACVGFGMERVTLALFKHHGLNPNEWPVSVRAQIWP